MQTTRPKRSAVVEPESRFHLSGPLTVGLIFASMGFVLAVVGIVRGMVPLNPISIGLALSISAVGWGVVSWAIATATVDVEADIAEAEAQEGEHE